MKKPPAAFATTAAAAALSLGALAVAPVPAADAAQRRWSGGANPDDRWSLGANWLGGVAPVDGDGVLFVENPTGRATLDYSLSLDYLYFGYLNANRTDLHVAAGPTTLTFTGSGLATVDGSPYYPPVRSTVFADGAASNGATGGTIVFANSSYVGGTYDSTGTELTASGGLAAGAGGGLLLFRDQSATAGVNGNVNTLFAEGGAVAGAAGGTIQLRDDARGLPSASMIIRGGAVAGAAGGQLLVGDRARLGGNIYLDPGSNGGAGGTAAFSGNAVLIDNGRLTIGSGASAGFSGNASLQGAALLLDATTDGQVGGRLEFRGHATFASVNPDPGYAVSIGNSGTYLPGAAAAGRTDFYDDSAITGPQAYIGNNVSEGQQPGSGAGVLTFHDRANAGAVSITNQGAFAAGPGTTGGQTFFLDDATAADAVITSIGGYAADAPGGRTEFAGNSTAARATLTANGGTNGGGGGLIVFAGNASGGSASVVLDGNGTLDISGSQRAFVPIGSVEGTTGIVNLGGQALAVGYGNRSTEFGGVIQGGGSLFKYGSGAFTLSGASTYTGQTQVYEGSLVVNGSLQTSQLGVSDGATLRGAGSVAGLVIARAGSTLAPGTAAAPGTLTLGELNVPAGANPTFVFRLGSAGNDRVDVLGNLTLEGTLNLAASGAFNAGTYRLFNYGGGSPGPG